MAIVLQELFSQIFGLLIVLDFVVYQSSWLVRIFLVSAVFMDVGVVFFIICVVVITACAGMIICSAYGTVLKSEC